MSSIDLIKAFQTLGCTNEINCALASAVYQDLRDEVKATNLEYHYDKQLDLIYFRGDRGNRPEIIIPVSSSENVDLLRFEEIQRKLSGDTKSMTIAICDPGSTILYYTAINDFIEN